MLARIYGVFTVLMEDLVPVHILLMANSAQAGKQIQHVFDLKGSIINREVPKNKFTKGSTQKDVNLLKLSTSEVVLLFQDRDRKLIMEQIYHDIKFLSAHNLMDYSLLLVIELNPKYVEKVERNIKRTNSMRRTEV